MRLLDAVSTLKPKKHEKTTTSRMTTIWSEQIDPGSVLPEYPRPQFRRENWICLNGPCLQERINGRSVRMARSWFLFLPNVSVPA